MSDRQINPEKNGWEATNDRAAYDATIAGLTPYNAENMQDAYDQAAKNGKGIGFLVGSFGTDDTQKTAQKLKELQAANPGMVVVYLDRDQIANGGERYADLQKWVDNNTQGADCSFMAQYAVRPGEGGKAEGGQRVATHWGSDLEDYAGQQAIADKWSAPHAGKYTFQEKAEKEGPASVETRPLDVENQYNALQAKLKEASQSKNFDDFKRNFAARPSSNGKDLGGAIAQADSIDQKAVGEELTKTASDIDVANKAVEAAAGTPQEAQARQQLEALRARQHQLETLRDAPARTRAEYAQGLMAEGDRLIADKKRTDGEKLKAEAYAHVNDAAALNPAYFATEEGKQRLSSMKFSPEAIEQMGKAPVYGPEQPSPHNVADNLFAMTPEQKEEMAKPGKDAEREALQRKILDAAIKEARARNLPLVVKYGMKGCEPCDFMDENTLKPLAEAWKGKAVVAALDGQSADQPLLEHGVKLDGMGWPALDVYDVSQSGNLSLREHFEPEKVVNMNTTDLAQDPANKNVTPLLDRMASERTERARLAEEARVKQAQQAEERQRQADEQRQRRAREAEEAQRKLEEQRRVNDSYLVGLGFSNLVLVS